MFELIMLDEATSTNDYAKENLLENSVYYTTKQTKGRATKGRTWTDKDGNLAISITLSDYDKLKTGIYPQILALSLCQMVDGAKIKWPNDVILNNKKIAGILTEEFDGHLIIGIGININNEKIDKDIEDKATSLYIESGTKLDTDSVVEELIYNFSNNLSTSTLDEINKLSWLSGKTFNIDGQKAKFSRVLDNGSLEVDIEGNKKVLVSHEVSLKDIY